MKFLKPKFIIFLSILASVLILISYIYYSDNKDKIVMPENIIPVNQGITTAYLIKIPAGFLLFDTGYEKDYGIFKNILKKKKIDLSGIKFVILSHHHDDHAGYIGRLVSEYPAIKIIVQEKSIPLLASGKNNKNNGGGIVNSLIFGLFRIKQIITPDWTLTFPPFAVRKGDIVIKDDLYSLSSLAGINAAIVYTPGHSTDGISLIVDNDYLLCGDLASNFLNWAGADYLTLFNEDINNVYKSWEKIYGLKVKYILPSHGRAFSANRLKQNLNKYSQDDLVRFF